MLLCLTNNFLKFSLRIVRDFFLRYNCKKFLEVDKMITGEFDEEILQDLINEGYEGNELLQKFKEMRGKVPVAMEKMLNDLIEQYGGKFYTMKEVFSDE